MTAHTKVGGAWKDVSAISTKVGGAWKDVAEGYTKISGSWKQFFAPGGGYWLGEFTSTGTVQTVLDVKIDEANEFIYVMLDDLDSTATRNIVLMQLAYDGTVNWQKQIQFSSNPRSFDLDSSGDIYLGFVSPTASADTTVMRINSSGSIVTQTTVDRRFRNTVIKVVGSNVYLGGDDSGVWRLAKLNTSLTVLWNKRYQDTLDSNNQITSIDIDPAGDVYAIGTHNPSASDEGAVLKVSGSDGNPIWDLGINTSNPLWSGSAQIYGIYLYFINEGIHLYRVDAATGTLDTSWGRQLATDVAAVKIDPADGSYYWMNAFDGGFSTEDGFVRYASETSGESLVFNNVLRIVGGNSSSAEYIAFDWNANSVAAVWNIAGLNVPNAMAYFPKDGSFTSESVSLTNTYTWETSATTISTVTDPTVGITLSVSSQGTTTTASSLTLSPGTITLTKGNFA